MTTVALAGDWHGNTAWALQAINQIHTMGIKRIYHLGDFGIWPGPAGRVYLDEIDAATRQAGIEIWITPGNHEDYAQIAALTSDLRADGLLDLRRNIAVVPRGQRWEQAGRTFVSLGGAPSIDFEARTEHVDWWRDEMITLAEAVAVAEDGHADIMLTHDAPDGGTDAVQAIIDTPPERNPWSQAGLSYAWEGRQLMNLAVQGVRPRIFAHGHFHAPDDTGPVEGDGTRYLSLGADMQQMNVALLDLNNLTVSWDGRTWK